MKLHLLPKRKKKSDVMEPFCDFEFYDGSYLCGRQGKIPESDFLFFSTRATAKIKAAVNPAFTIDIDDSVKCLTCEIAEIIYQRDVGTIDQSGEVVQTGISSERIGDYSVTYAANSQRDADDIAERRISRAIRAVLGPRGVLYRGVI